MLCGFPLSAPQRNWQPGLARKKTQSSVLYTHKKRFWRFCSGSEWKNSKVLCRKFNSETYRIAQNLGHWWHIFPLESKYYSALVSPLAVKELWPLGYWLFQTMLYALSLLSKTQPFCTGEVILTSHFLMKNNYFPRIPWCWRSKITAADLCAICFPLKKAVSSHLQILRSPRT